MNRDTWKLVRRMKAQRLASAAKAINSATIRAARKSAIRIASMNNQIAASRTAVRQARPNSKRRRKAGFCLKAMLFHAPVKGAAAEAQFRRRQRDVEVVHPERALDHLFLELVEIEVAAQHLQRRRIRPARQREVLDPVAVAVS